MEQSVKVTPRRSTSVGWIHRRVGDPEFEETLGRYLLANVSYFRDPQDWFFISYTDPFNGQEIVVYLASTKLWQ